MYPKTYLELQMIFARRIAELSGVSFLDALLRYTDLYSIFGLKWSEDLPIWRQFTAELPSGSLGIKEAYQFYTQQYIQGHICDHAPGTPLWGCFSYLYHVNRNGVDIHFADRDKSGFGSLSHQRMEARLDELRAMFTYIRQEHPDAERVGGAGTWLLHRVQYRRLFPLAAVRHTWVAEPIYFGTGLWGQFLKRGPSLDEAAAAIFLSRVAKLNDANYVASCFPLQALRDECPIFHFYRYYGIGERLR